jgi:chorismate mutase
MTEDPLIKQIRQQISDTDRSIVDAMNTRLRLVARLKRYKESRGIGFVDPEREEWMLQYLQRMKACRSCSKGCSTSRSARSAEAKRPS